MSEKSQTSFPVVKTDPGVTRQILCENPDLMTVVFRFEPGAEGALHNHVHVQSTFVKEGKFLFHLDGEEIELNKGDSLIIPSNAVHGCKALEAGELLDTFTPRRDDFL